MADPEIKELLDKAEELKILGDRLAEQARKLQAQAAQLIERSKQLKDRKPADGKPKSS